MNSGFGVFVPSKENFNSCWGKCLNLKVKASIICLYKVLLNFISLLLIYFYVEKVFTVSKFLHVFILFITRFYCMQVDILFLSTIKLYYCTRQDIISVK